MNWQRISTVATAAVTLAFQMATEASATPAVAASAPWLDGRPVIEHMAGRPEWRPGGDGMIGFVRFDVGRGATYGIVEGETVHEIAGDLFSPGARTGTIHPVASVTVLPPLGPLQFGNAHWLGARSAMLAHPVLHIGPHDLLGPGDGLIVGLSSGVVRPVVGLVVGGTNEGPHLFGLTAGFLSSGPSFVNLALGPIVVRDLDPRGMRVETGVGDSSLRIGDFSSHCAPGLSRANTLVARGSVASGDVLLIPVSEGTRPSDAGGISVYNRIPEVGELRCTLRYSPT